MMYHLSRKISALFLFAIICSTAATAQKDTLRVMGYNVLYYGNGCQGPNGNYHNYLKTIVGFTNPDVISLEKMGSIPTSTDDKFGAAPYGFADSILKYALNAAFPGRYAYCPFSNRAKANNVAILFYDTRKLGFASLVSSYVNITDFNTYKLYYKDPNLGSTGDTTYLYVTLNHDKSGDENEGVRKLQIAGEMDGIKHHLSKLANHINIGDFNLHSSKEACYQLLTAPEDSNFRFFDPPFYPDQSLKYPGNWDHEAKYARYFTTSTRESATIPNACGSGGGGKNWYDHIFLSSWIVNNTNYIKYIPHSYRTVGNDGERYKVSINNKNSHVNNSAPDDVIEALYQFSNKYPVMVDLEVTQNTSGRSVADPEFVSAKVVEQEQISVKGTGHFAKNEPISILFPESMMEQDVTIEILDNTGASQLNDKIKVKNTVTKLKHKLAPGKYSLKFMGKHNLIWETAITID